MPVPKLSRLERQIMEALWTKGPSCVRDIQETFPERGRPAYTTVQTMVSRMEAKGLVQRVRKISNAHIFDAAVSREAAGGRLIDDLLNLFNGRTQPVMAHLIRSGKLTLTDVREAEKSLRAMAREEKVK
jgi:BlaI family transcriptional regulator, penicillinase repressor